MKLRIARPVIMVAAATLLAGCAAAMGESDPFSRTSRETEIKVFVTNLAFMDVTLYGVTNGGRHRLGRLTGKRDFVFTLPMRAPSEFYIELDFLAGPKCQTERMMVEPGEHLELIVQNDSQSYRCRGT